MADLEARKLTGNCAVEVKGLDVRDIDDEAVAELRALVGEHCAVVLPGQHLTNDDEIAFAARWGRPHARPGHSGVATIDAEQRPSKTSGAWHSDMSWAPVTPYATFLHAVTIPPVGGDTMFANQYAAYESLPEQLRQRISGLTAEHRHPNPPGRFAAGSSTHPLVRTIPETGRTALFVNPAFVRRIEGLDEVESRKLLFMLMRFATRPEVTYRHQWSPGDLLVWDNRSTLHYAVADYDEPRVMHRVTVREPGQ